MGKGKPSKAKMSTGTVRAAPNANGKNGTQSSNVKKVAPQVIVGTVRAPRQSGRGR